MTVWNWLAVGGAAVLALVLVAEIRGRAATGPTGRRFFRHPTAAPALFVLAFFVTVALAAPLVTPYRPYFQIDITRLANHAPSEQNPLGTDPFGRDVWSRLVYGARISLGIGALAMLVAVTTGVVVGGVAGYFRRWVDATLMRLVDIGLAMPRMFMLLMVVALWEHVPLAVLVLLIGLTGWFGTSRLVRAEVLSVREREFVAALRRRVRATAPPRRTHAHARSTPRRAPAGWCRTIPSTRSAGRAPPAARAPTGRPPSAA